MEAVVGGLVEEPAASYRDRWEIETAYFTEAILRHMTSRVVEVLDYGCGCGRFDKPLLAARPNLHVTGVDPSSEQLQLALKYVNGDGKGKTRFNVWAPDCVTVGYRADVVLCIYVLQHVPAVELRDAIRIMAQALPKGGLLIYSNSDARSAMRFDRADQFFDDRFLGVSLVCEVERYFGNPVPLFDRQAKEPWLQKLVEMHRNCVYRRL